MTVTPPEDLEEPLYGDAEIVSASGVPVPSLRVLQGAGALSAQKVPKAHGGFRRMWREVDGLKAAVAAAMGEHFAWNIRQVAEALGKTEHRTWNAMIHLARADAVPVQTGKRLLIRASPHDWHLELVDRRFLFLRVPDLSLALWEGAVPGQNVMVLGFVEKEGFTVIPWTLGTPAGRAAIKARVAGRTFEKVDTLFRIAKASHGNVLSLASVNVSMQVRMAWHRLQGQEPHLVQDLIQPRKG